MSDRKYEIYMDDNTKATVYTNGSIIYGSDFIQIAAKDWDGRDTLISYNKNKVIRIVETIL